MIQIIIEILPSKSKLKQAPKAGTTSFVTSYYHPSIDIDNDETD